MLVARVEHAVHELVEGPLHLVRLEHVLPVDFREVLREFQVRNVLPQVPVVGRALGRQPEQSIIDPQARLRLLDVLGTLVLIHAATDLGRGLLGLLVVLLLVEGDDVDVGPAVT